METYQLKRNLRNSCSLLTKFWNIPIALRWEQLADSKLLEHIFVDPSIKLTWKYWVKDLNHIGGELLVEIPEELQE